jgi:hypothetical protein
VTSKTRVYARVGILLLVLGVMVLVVLSGLLGWRDSQPIGIVGQNASPHADIDHSQGTNRDGPLCPDLPTYCLYAIPEYRVDVFRQDAQDSPIQRLSFVDRESLEAGFRQIVQHWAPRKDDIPVGITVYSKRDGWIDPHSEDKRPTGRPPPITWLELSVQVGHGKY